MTKVWVGFIFLVCTALSLAAPEYPQPAPDRDYNAFLYSLGFPAMSSEKTSVESESSSNLYLLAQREMVASGLNSRELYEKFQQILTQIHPSLKKLFAAKAALQAENFKREVRCFELGCTAGVIAGASLSLSAGLVHTPRWSYPTFGLRLRVLIPEGSSIILGAFAEIGTAVSQRSAAQSDLQNFETEISKHGQNHIGAFIVGNYAATYREGTETRGFTLGGGGSNATLYSTQLQVPLKIPVYYFDYEKPLLKILQELVSALYFFDFHSAELLAKEFNIKTEVALSKLQKRGLLLGEAEMKQALPEHPLASAGMLFHPRTLLRYAPPKLLPPTLTVLDCEQSANKKGPSLLGFKL